MAERITERQVMTDLLRTLGSRPDMRLWRQNTGKALPLGSLGGGFCPRCQLDLKRAGTVIAFGVPGAADLSGLLSDGKRLEVEAKSPRGRQREQQRRFEQMVEKFDGVYILARSAEDALRPLRERGYAQEDKAA